MRATSLLLAAGAASASAMTTATSVPSSTVTGEPCAIVSASLAAIGPSGRPAVPAEVGYNCLNSVKVDVAGDIQQIEELKAYLQWQTTFTYLSNPPAGYTEKPVDILGGLDLIAQMVKNGSYTSEWAVQSNISSLLSQAYDGHLLFASDMASVIVFERNHALVSISKDGVALPELYIYEDIMKTQNGEKFTPSSVKTINGQNATSYVSNQALQVTYHDADTRFNTMFPNQALISTGENYVGYFALGQYDGPSTSYVFSNGSTLDSPNLALIQQSFDGVDSGESFFSTFCQGPTSSAAATATPSAASSTAAASSTEAASPTPSATGYPEPVVIHSGLAIGGYFINETGFEDVAVLSIPLFEPPNDSILEFQDVLREFLATATSSGKTRLVVDTRGNGGGNTILGFEVFKQLFPSIAPFGASRFHAHSAFELIGAALTDVVNNETFIQQDGADYLAMLGNFSFFDYKLLLDVNNQDFTSFEDYFGPHVVHGDNYTAVWRYNFSNPISTSYTSFSLTGYVNNTKVTAQPFKAENIVLLQDGFCSSTCTIFSELMKEQGKVESIAVGGLPANAPMQAIGGTKGSMTLRFDNIQSLALMSFDLAAVQSEKMVEMLNTTIINTLAYPQQLLNRVGYSSNGGTRAQINAADNLRNGDASETPLEFVYEAADCRIFYTAEMVANVEETWKAVATAKWGKGGCVPGSTGAPSSISGGVYNSTNSTTLTQQNPNAASTWGAPGVFLVAAGAVIALFL